MKRERKQHVINLPRHGVTTRYRTYCGLDPSKCLSTGWALRPVTCRTCYRFYTARTVAAFLLTK